MAEYSANTLQTVNPGETVLFTTTDVPCNRGLVLHRPGSGDFVLRGWRPRGCRRTCCCNGDQGSVIYDASFGANIAVPTGETVGQISLAISVNGAALQTSTMISSPEAVEEFNNVGREISVPIWLGCCQTVSVRNTSAIPILVQNANLKFTRADLNVTY